MDSKRYPQNIQNVQWYSPGIYSSNLYGLKYPKSKSSSFKREYNKEYNFMNEERFTSTNQIIYKKGKNKSIEEEKYMNKTSKRFLSTLALNNLRNYSLDKIHEIYCSKIANVLQILENFGKKRLSKLSTDEASYSRLLPKSQEALKIVKYDAFLI